MDAPGTIARPKEKLWSLSDYMGNMKSNVNKNKVEYQNFKYLEISNIVQKERKIKNIILNKYDRVIYSQTSD